METEIFYQVGQIPATQSQDIHTRVYGADSAPAVTKIKQKNKKKSHAEAQRHGERKNIT